LWLRHLRSRGRGRCSPRKSTGEEKESNQAHLEWTPSPHGATGPSDSDRTPLADSRDPGREAASGGRWAIDRWASSDRPKQYSAARIEAADDRALLTGSVPVPEREIDQTKSLDQQPLHHIAFASSSAMANDNIRGAEYFELVGSKEERRPCATTHDGKTQCPQAARLSKALERQETRRGRASNEPSASLALMIDQQWTGDRTRSGAESSRLPLKGPLVWKIWTTS